MNIAVTTRSMNVNLYDKMRSTCSFNAKYLRYTEFQTGPSSLDYLLLISQLEYDYVINVDEDIAFIDDKVIYEIIDYMEENNYDYCGVADGGEILVRINNPLAMNPFFNIFNAKKIRTMVSQFDLNINSKKMLEEDWDKKLKHPKKCKYQYNDAEPFYPFFYNLIKMGIKGLYLSAENFEDEISTIVKFNNKNILCHTWYAREYKKYGSPHRDRIDRVFDFFSKNKTS